MLNHIDSTILITGQEESGKTFLSYAIATNFINYLQIQSSKVNIIVNNLNINSFWSLVMPNANIFDRNQHIANIKSSIMESYNSTAGTLLIFDDCISGPNDVLISEILQNDQISAANLNTRIIVVCKNINTFSNSTLAMFNKYYIMKYSSPSEIHSLNHYIQYTNLLYNNLINHHQLEYDDFINLYSTSTPTLYSSLLIKNNPSMLQHYSSFPEITNDILLNIPPHTFNTANNVVSSMNSLFGNNTYTTSEIHTLLGNTIPITNTTNALFGNYNQTNNLLSNNSYFNQNNQSIIDDTNYYDNLPTSDEDIPETNTSISSTWKLLNSLKKKSTIKINKSTLIPLNAPKSHKIIPKFNFDSIPKTTWKNTSILAPTLTNKFTNNYDQLKNKQYHRNGVIKIQGHAKSPITVASSPNEFGIQDLRTFSGFYILRM